ncbi:unnamed protein product [Ranitomeya imitator]|uniref:Transposase Tc1-like domain-containing protein n=1 Tax=Ranitomeya imitator TaxID=111125 RepID=A0ABN9L4H2_9NEOB|nr:unnamed protein product [Ranitomeya imitator]
MVKRNPFTTANQVNNTLQDGGVSISKSTIKRRLHESKYRGFTARCKPLISIKNKKARLDFAKKYLKKPAQFWKNILWTDETKINLYQNDGKRKRLRPYHVIKYDVEKDEPVRDAAGHCICVAKGEPGLLISEITITNPFTGYAGEESQTEKKRLRNVFKMGDVYFNTGDLVMIDKQGFIFFQDRVGDTFRVSDISPDGATEQVPKSNVKAL